MSLVFQEIYVNNIVLCVISSSSLEMLKASHDLQLFLCFKMSSHINYFEAVSRALSVIITEDWKVKNDLVVLESS